MHTYAASLPVRSTVQVLKALGDETRLRIMALLSHGELYVGDLADVLHVSQPNASRHLAVLRAAGIVAQHRRGTFIQYALVLPEDPQSRRMLELLIRGFTADAHLAANVKALKAKGSPKRK
jgi:ArsR family transcriptional regulator